MLAYRSESKNLDVIVSNLSSPWKRDPFAIDAFSTLKEGQFWFCLHISELSSNFYSCFVKGYERRGLLRFEICEYLSNTLWNGFLKQDSVC